MQTIAIVLPGLGDLSQYVFSGLTQGCLYALIALAFVTIANVTGVYNFAQGDWIMIGGMVTVAALGAGIPVIVAVLLSMLAVAGVALVQERFTVAPIRDRVGMLGLVVGTLGFGVLLRGVALVLWGDDVLSVDPFQSGTFHLLGAALDYQTLWVWATTAIALAITVALFRYTDIGRAMRACALNPLAARLVGIRIGRMSMSAFLLGGALSGVIGAVIVPLTSVSWTSGLAVGLVGFIAAALARFESPAGAVIAGLALGVTQALAAGIVSSAYADAIVYSVLIVYLVGRGLFGSEGSISRLSHRRTTAKARAAVADIVAASRRRAREAGAGLTRAAQVETPRIELNRAKAAGAAGLIALAVVVPFLTNGNPQATDTAIFIVLSAIGATGLSLVLGVAGQFSLGQAAFYMVGGYGTGILAAQAGIAPIPAILIAVALAVLAGFLLGALTLRLEGFNLAITTLAFQLILIVVALQFTSLTGGPLGVGGMPIFEVLGWPAYDPWNFYWIALAVLVVCLVVARNLTFSKVGRALRAIAADEAGAESLGIDADRLKLGVLCVGAAMAGLGGALWASYLQYAAPSTWDFNLMIALIAYVIVGGVGSIYGGLIGAVTVGVVQFLVTGSVSTGIGSGSSEFQIILNGALIVGFILLFPGGLTGIYSSLRTRFSKPRPGSDSPPGSTRAGEGAIGPSSTAAGEGAGR